MSTAPSRKELTHERIVGVAARAIRRVGYDGVGVADVMKEAGLTHGGFYAHFDSRNALLVEAMDRAGRDSAAVIAERLSAKAGEGVPPFTALLQAYLGDHQLGNAEHGCAVAALASEMPRQPDEVLDAARRRVQALIDLVRRCLPAGADAEQAPVITATMVGAVQLARTLGGKAGKALLASTRQALTERHETGAAG